MQAGDDQEHVLCDCNMCIHNMESVDCNHHRRHHNGRHHRDGWLTYLCHSNGHIETMLAREMNPFTALIPVSQDTMIDEQSSASEHDYASDRSAIGAGLASLKQHIVLVNISLHRDGPEREQ